MLNKTLDKDNIDDTLEIKENVIAVQTFKDGTKKTYTTHNLITTDGANYYAELSSIGRAGSGSPTNAFDSALLGNSLTPGSPAIGDDFSDFVPGTVGLSTEKVVTSAAINNLDTENTGKGAFIFTWKAEWSAGDFDTEGVDDISSGIITIPSPTGTDPILNHFIFPTPFEKLSTSSLIVWVNHTFADNT